RSPEVGSTPRGSGRGPVDSGPGGWSRPRTVPETRRPRSSRSRELPKTAFMSARPLVAAAALLVLAGCSTATKPTSPTPQTPLPPAAPTPPADTLTVGNSTAFTVTAIDTNGAPVANPVVQWSSSNATVFTVSSGGVVTAHSEGSATLQASSGGKVANATV